MPTTALDVYQSLEGGAATSRQLEAALLFKAARQLDTVVREWGAEDRAAKLREALLFNTRLWAVFHASMEEPDSPLPAQLRVNILQLACYVDRRTLEIYKAPTPDKLQPLININRRIATGLSVVIAPAATAEHGVEQKTA
jgi:flagellar biosynthesis activator protein FlaF